MNQDFFPCRKVIEYANRVRQSLAEYISWKNVPHCWWSILFDWLGTFKKWRLSMMMSSMKITIRCHMDVRPTGNYLKVRVGQRLILCQNGRPKSPSNNSNILLPITLRNVWLNQTPWLNLAVILKATLVEKFPCHRGIPFLSYWTFL